MNVLNEFRAAAPPLYTDAAHLCNAIIGEVFMFSTLVHAGILITAESYGGVYTSPKVVLNSDVDHAQLWVDTMQTASEANRETGDIASYMGWDDYELTTSTLLTVKDVTLRLRISIEEDPVGHFGFRATCETAEPCALDNETDDDESMDSEMDTATDTSFHADDNSDDDDESTAASQADTDTQVA